MKILSHILALTLPLTLNFALPLALQSATVHVTPTGAGDLSGSSWANAAPGANLRALLLVTTAGDQVWVACGLYTPIAGTDRSLSYSMRSGVEIYGGFAGTENAPGERDLSCGPCSILSGEIGAPGNTDNSYKVVYNELLDSTAVLDGFQIRDANDDRTPTSFGNGLGGGVYNHGFNPGGYCHPTLRNCVFSNNSASWGAGAFNNGYNGGNAEPTYINCIFRDNFAYIEAPGMDSYGVGGNASPTLYNCVFTNNTSTTNVGAMYAWGGNANGNCHPLLVNCVFVNNQASNGYCGALVADNLDENGNTSSGSCTVTLRNCIVWNNTASGISPQFHVRGNGAQVIATYSDIDLTGQNGLHVISGPGTGNFSLDPLFLNLANPAGNDSCWLSSDDGLRLQPGSPCINTGSNLGVHSTDLTGNPRITGPIVDMGAYESTTPLGLPHGPKASSLTVFPNPAADWITVQHAHGLTDEVRLMNSLGQGLQVAKVSETEGSTRLDLRGLPKGIYWVGVNGDAELVLLK